MPIANSMVADWWWGGEKEVEWMVAEQCGDGDAGGQIRPKKEAGLAVEASAKSLTPVPDSIHLYGSMQISMGDSTGKDLRIPTRPA